MNNSHLHLVFNHLPIIFPVVGILLLLLGVFTKSETTKRNAYIIFILGALATIIAMATGENAEDAIEKLPGISKNLIHTHEEASELFAGLSYILGGFSLIALIASLKDYNVKKYSPFVIALLAAAALFFAMRAGATGGEISHEEIRSGATINVDNHNDEHDSDDYDNDDHKKSDKHKD